MKNLFKLLLLAAVAVVGAACDNEEKPMRWESDFSCYSVEFAVEDAETGEDLLDPATEGNILGQEIKVIYQGKEYIRSKTNSLNWSVEPSTTSRVNCPRPFALRWGRSNSSYSYLVAFGEFDPTQDFHQESFIIDWGDGTQNEIVLDCNTSGSALWVDGVARGDHWRIEIKK